MVIRAEWENKKIAEQIINQGAFIIPLFPNSKHNNDKDILKRIYPATDVGENDNVGMNLGLSGIYALDGDSTDGIHWCNEW